MSFLKSFYKTSALAQNGFFVLSIGLLLLIFGLVIIPEVKSPTPQQQVYTLNGYNTKHNDNPEVAYFFQSIKKSDGYLCLGTSESGTLEGKNYFNFLNNDPQFDNTQFSILSGAGRTCGIYIPLFLHHKKELEGLKVIYFINPVYWRTDLCDVNLEYWNRYSNYGMCSQLSLSSIEKEEFFNPVQAYYNKLSVINKAAFSSEHFIRKARRKYFHDLRMLGKSEEFTKQFDYISSQPFYTITSKEDYKKASLDQTDTIWNISKSFHHKEWFKPINESSDYRYNELKSFVLLCKKLGIEATFIVGPYNEIFIKRFEEKSLRAYKETTNNVKKLLQEVGADYVDATDISGRLGAFDDHQHHSIYGAYLIYERIKQHLNEKEKL